MTGTEQDLRRTKHGRLAAAIGAAAAVAVLVPIISALALARATPAASRAAEISGTGRAGGALTTAPGPGAGWAPVPYRDAQLSVPGSWLVETPQELFCGFSPRGMIFAGLIPRFPKGSGCRLTASLAWIVPAGHVGPGIRHRKPTAVIHGIRVYRLPSGTGSVLYLVPDLGVRVGARGPDARRVLATLSRSPLSVVLKRGPASPVPASWAWRQFGGVRFATSRSWAPLGTDLWATCGTGLTPRTLLLIDATLPPQPLPCPFPLPTAAADQAQPGLTVVTGKYAAQSVSQTYVRCLVRRSLRICLSSVTGQGGFYSGVLIFSVSGLHRRAGTFFLLGLSGTGTTARTIFDSISPAQQ